MYFRILLSNVIFIVRVENNFNSFLQTYTHIITQKVAINIAWLDYLTNRRRFSHTFDNLFYKQKMSRKKIQRKIQKKVSISKFKINDIVFSKLRGYAAWPSFIREIIGTKIKVDFVCPKKSWSVNFSSFCI